MAARGGESPQPHDPDLCDEDDCPIVRWNHRVVARTVYSGVPGDDPHEDWSLIEAYYDDHGRIVAYCDAGPVVGDNLPDLYGEAKARVLTIEKALQGVDGHAVLDPADLPGDPADIGGTDG